MLDTFQHKFEQKRVVTSVLYVLSERDYAVPARGGRGLSRYKLLRPGKLKYYMESSRKGTSYMQ